MRLPLVVLVTLLVVPALTACGDGPAGGTAGGARPSDQPTTGPTSDPTSGLPDDRLPGDPSAKPREVRTLTGVLTAGVEAGCLLLEDGSRSWLLLGPDVAGARPGARVVVVGTPSPGTVTTCQQGTPFVVTGLRAAAD